MSTREGIIRRWRAAVLAVAATLVLAAGCGGDTASNDPPAPTKEAVEPPDTGRMSDGEWDMAKGYVDRVNEEISQYGEGGPRCVTIYVAGQMAEALDCVDKAYGGLEEGFGYASSSLDGMKGDVGKVCRKSLVKAQTFLDGPLYRAFGGIKTAWDTGDLSIVTVASREAVKRQRTWNTLSQRMIVDCAPR